MKHMGKVGWLLFMLWGASTMWQVYTQGSGGQISIFGQLFISVGLSYIALYLILLWFIRKTGLNRLPHILEKMEMYLEEEENQDGTGGI